MAYLLQSTSNPDKFYAGVRGTKILWTTYEDGRIDFPILFITEEALEAAQMELADLVELQRWELEGFALRPSTNDDWELPQ